MDILFKDDQLLVIRTKSGHELRISNCERGEAAFLDIWGPETLAQHCISEVTPDRVITLEGSPCGDDDATVKL